MTVEATEILCSENPQGDRLMTMLWRHPKFNHQETLRHRKIYIEDNLALTFDPDFSLSVSSSRAIPFRKMLEEVSSDELRAAPVYWGAEQKGMSPGEELDDSTKSIFWPQVLHDLGDPNTKVTVRVRDVASSVYRENWVTPRECSKRLWALQADVNALIAQVAVEQTHEHKSIANRRIETFVHVNCLATATTAGWLNFFGLRLDAAADPTLRALAEAAWKVWNESRPQKLKPGQWHLPFVDDETVLDCRRYWESNGDFVDYKGSSPGNNTIWVSVARCARLSYMSFETNKRSTIDEDLALYKRLVGSVPLHASPAEHQATPDLLVAKNLEMNHPMYGLIKLGDIWTHGDQVGNLGPGWRQYRKMLPNEAIAPLPEAYR